MAYLGMANPDVFRQAIRSSVSITYTVDASLGAQPVVSGLQPTGGSITDTTKPGVRRVLNLELAPEPGLFDLLAPVGMTLTVTAHVRLTDRSTVDIPMGVFDVDSEKMSEGGGSLSLTAPDKWARLQRARFIGPAPSYPNVSVVEQIILMIRDALGPLEPVIVRTNSRARMAPVVWEKYRDKAIIGLARDIGCWVYFDRNGVATIADLQSAGEAADWLVDSSATGVLTELDRERSRANTFNVVVVESSASDGAAFPLQYVWDNDPTSPTYAGVDPVHGIGVGPFGVVPYYHDTPLPLDANAAWHTGYSILLRVSGLASQVSLGQVPNPAVDAFDVLDVMPPGGWETVVVSYREGASGSAGFGSAPFGTSPFGGDGVRGRPILGRVSRGAVLERHIADTVTHPLTLGSAQRIEGRSTRYEDVEGGM